MHKGSPYARIVRSSERSSSTSFMMHQTDRRQSICIMIHYVILSTNTAPVAVESKQKHSTVESRQGGRKIDRGVSGLTDLPAKVRASVATRKTRRPGALGTRVGSIHAGGAQGDRWQPTEKPAHRTVSRQLRTDQSTPTEPSVFGDYPPSRRGLNDQDALSVLRRSARKSTDVSPHPDAADNPLLFLHSPFSPSLFLRLLSFGSSTLPL